MDTVNNASKIVTVCMIITVGAVATEDGWKT